MAIVARISFTAAAETRVFEIFNGQITAQSSSADVDLYGSNMPTDASSWQSIGTVVGGYAPTSISTGLSHIKAVAAGPTIFAASDIDQAGTGGGGGGGGGAVTIADGADVAQGARAQTAATDDTGTWSLVQLTKRGLQRITTILDRLPALVSGRMPVDGSGVTQPVSAAALPLPAGAATESTLAAASAKLPALVSGRTPVDPTGAVQTGTGAVTATTQRVTLATDSPGVLSLSSIDGKLPTSLGGKASAASLSVTAATGTITSVGGTVAAGGTAQQLAAANTARRGLTVQNTSAGELRVNVFGTASASAGYRVMAGELLVLDAPHCGVGAVSIWGATTGQAFIGGEAV